MKKFLKIALLALTVFAVACPHAGTAGTNDYIGEWTCTAVDLGDGVLLKEYEGIAVGDLMKLNLEDNGSLVLTSVGEAIPGTWTEAADGITAIIDVQEVSFRLLDGKLVNINNGVTIYLEKTVAAPKTGGLLSLVTLGKYTGRWVSTAVDEGDGVLITEIEGMKVDGLIVFQINRGGTLTMTSMGMDSQGSWEEISGGIRVTMDDEPIDLMLVDGQLTGKDEETTFYFRRDTQAAPSTQAPDAPVSFAGVWNAIRYEMTGYTFDITMLFPDGCVLTLREDGTGEVTVTKDFKELLTWSQSGNTLSIAGNYYFSSPVWNMEKEELGLHYSSDAITVVFKKSTEKAIAAQPTPVPVPDMTLAPTAEPAPEPTPEPTPEATAEPATAQPAGSLTESVTNLFTAHFAGEGWTENAGWRTDREDYSYVRFELKDASDSVIAAIALTASSEGVGTYRDKIRILKEYAAEAGEDTLEEVTIGGISFQGTDYEKWGWNYAEYTARAVDSGVTLTVLIEQPEIIGDRLQSVLDSIAYKLPVLSPPNVDPPLPEEGTAYQPAPANVTIGDRELTATWLKADGPIILDSIFNNTILADGSRLYVLAGKTLQAFLLSDGSLVPDLSFNNGSMLFEDNFEYLARGEDGTLFVSHGIYNILAVRDGAVIKDNSLSGDLVMHPSGEWGLTFWANADPMYVKNDSGVLSEQPWVLSGLSDASERKSRFSMLSCIYISDTRIYAAGTDTLSGDAQRVAVYDLEGKELFTFGGADWTAEDAFGSVTGILETPDSILVLDGNYRAFKLFSLEGEFLGEADSDELLGTDYPWLSSMVAYEDGALVAAAQSREDGSADELLIFLVKGF